MLTRGAFVGTVQPVLIAGAWRTGHHSGTFQAENPATLTPLDEAYPISTWADCSDALDAAVSAFHGLRSVSPETIAAFLEDYAKRIESQADGLVEIAHQETALPKAPRLREVELPRTANQLRQAAQAARDGSWRQATLDTRLNIRSVYSPLGPIAVFGPNNFPFAFNSVAGGDFAAAIAAGNPVIAKANTSHPGTTRLLAELAQQAAGHAELPAGTIQLLYRTSHADGEKLVADPRLGATGYTGSRAAGLRLKAAADRAGKPIYLELSSINPVVLLPGAVHERSSQIEDEFVSSCLMGTGQFCTNPGLVLLLADAASERLVADLGERFRNAPVGTLLSQNTCRALTDSVHSLAAAGAKVVTGGESTGGTSASFHNTLLRVSAKQFIAHPHELQTEAFGNVSLLVVAESAPELRAALEQLEGNLTGTFYIAQDGSDDALYAQLEPVLRTKVGRLLNDKMPTGVAVSPAMNHGGPYPATGHPGFTAVGIPASLRRFARLDCYDNVRNDRLPPALADRNPTGQMWRSIDGRWSQHDVA